MDKLNMLPIDIDYLQDGLVVRDDIFNFDGKIVLLSAGEVLTDHKIMRLRKFNKDSSSIYVSKDTYNDIIEAKAPESEPQPKAEQALPKAASSIAEAVEYDILQNDVKSFIDNIAKDGEINFETAKAIKNNVKEKIKNVDVTDILACINSERPIDEDLERHSLNVGIINAYIGSWLNLSESDIDALVIAGIIHDVGKTKIPTEILNAPRKLTDEEMSVIKNHPTFSYEIAFESPDIREDILNAALYHHEKIDGTGYPKGLFGEEIPLFAKITAVSDVYDALISKRSYKSAVNPFEILNMIDATKLHFDPDIKDVFIYNMPAQLIGSNVLMSNGEKGIVRFVFPNDLKSPIIEIDGVLRQVTDDWYCEQINDEKFIKKETFI